jgi:hypothetical protein
MEVLYPRCAGLDVHAANVVACVRLASGATGTSEHRTFSTNTRGLLELAEWLMVNGCGPACAPGKMKALASAAPRVHDRAHRG